MPAIADKQIDPFLRPLGILLRRSAAMDEETLMKLNRAQAKLMKGRWASLRTVMHEHYVRRPDGSWLRLCVVRKKGSRKTDCTGLLWIHGGGYAIGLPEQDVSFADLFCGDGSCVAVLPDYTLSPDAPYPAALDDCSLALDWMYRCHAALGIRKDQLSVGGDSAGGGLCLAECLYQRNIGHIPIAFAMPLYPMIDDRPTETNADNDAPVWDSNKNNAAWAMYLKGLKDIPVYAVPARETDYRGLPPMMTYVGDIEPFYAETLTLAGNLEKAGIAVEHRVFAGCFHGFDIVGGYAPKAIQARRFLKQCFRHAQKAYFKDRG